MLLRTPVGQAILSPVGMGVPPAKLHEKPGIITEAGDKVGVAVEKLRPFACLIRSMRALRE
jgi:hypothetical protein